MSKVSIKGVLIGGLLGFGANVVLYVAIAVGWLYAALYRSAANQTLLAAHPPDSSAVIASGPAVSFLVAMFASVVACSFAAGYAAVQIARTGGGMNAALATWPWLVFSAVLAYRAIAVRVAVTTIASDLAVFGVALLGAGIGGYVRAKRPRRPQTAPGMGTFIIR